MLNRQIIYWIWIEVNTDVVKHNKFQFDICFGDTCDWKKQEYGKTVYGTVTVNKN